MNKMILKTPQNQEEENKDLIFTDSEKSVSVSSLEVKKKILAYANGVIQALQKKDMDKLASFIHPVKGVRFSPYAYVNVKSDVVLNRAQIRNAFNDNREYIWGTYDGSGEPIKLNFKHYYALFIYDQDFSKAEKTTYDEAIAKGNTKNNISEVYPGSHVVEYYISGTSSEYQGMNWRSLRLVFEQYNGKWYLVGIVHDQWTM